MKIKIIELKIIKKLIEKKKLIVKCPSSLNYNNFSEKKKSFIFFINQANSKSENENLILSTKNLCKNFHFYYNELTVKLFSNILSNIQVVSKKKTKLIFL